MLWQSFDFPTDTLVSGMKLGWDAKSKLNRTLQSWRTRDNPSLGDFTYAVEVHQLTESFVRQSGVPTFRSGPWASPSDVKKSSEKLPYATYNLTATKEEATYSFTLTNRSFFSVFRLTDNGLLRRTTWRINGSILLEFTSPDDTCGSYNKCGANGLCDMNSIPICNCIHGFKARDEGAWELKDWKAGCVRKTPLKFIGDGFERLQKMKLPDTTESIVDRRIGLPDCRDKCIRNQNCTAYANGGSGCVIWVGGLLDIRKNKIEGQDLFVRLAATDISHAGGKKKTNTTIILVSVGVGLVILACLVFIWFCYWKPRTRPPKIVETTTTTIAAAPHNIEVLQFAPMELGTVAMATDNFSDSRKIGQGGFGTVYQGVLSDGRVIAAKRLLKRSAHSIEGFTNEVNLIASVQHINLVQLLGYCAESDEMVLVLEFLENSSLDHYIFDSTQSYKLNWEMRLEIAKGIARGLLYLHQDSRVRIIHRDLKPSNVLLDKNMIPKISDFGISILFARDETEATAREKHGTIGYMAPEYVTDGIYSIKYDIYSFGVLVLEMISGKGNAKFYCDNGEETLISFIWRQWTEGKGLDMVDPAIVNSSSTFKPHEALRCIQIALLCVQERAEDRPTMSSVILMLTSETAELEQPRDPGCFAWRRQSEVASSSSNTTPDLTYSSLRGR
ncbi:hypothetical protein AALP_AA6G313200 [Arabis alpina]|uniref:non-specific serine/threonine protein kinase n=1 Tax=Arabis alpina TaxID=50452 RepID=A0A087GSX0_ARAAL|nr:hypothetical protein AALP_AA6G313200 [Arabis alpina]